MLITIFLTYSRGSSIMNMITFVKNSCFFNPCHVSPMDVATWESFWGWCEAYVGKQPAIAIVTGHCMDFNLTWRKSHKSISIIFHRQEWERYCCFVDMIFDIKEMTVQLYKSAISFSTLPESIVPPPYFWTPMLALSLVSATKIKIPLSSELTGPCIFLIQVIPFLKKKKKKLNWHCKF